MTDTRRAGGRRQRRTFGHIRLLSSGRYQASYIGPDGQRHYPSKSFTAKTDAEFWLASERRRIENDEWVPPAALAASKKRSSITFEEFAKRWILTRETKQGRRLAQGTVDDYLRVLKQYLIPTFGDLLPREISRDQVVSWYQDAKLFDPKSPRARSKAYGLLRAIMNGAVDDGLVESSPVHIRGAGYLARRRRLEPVSLAELQTIVEAIDDRFRLLILIAAWCALRWGEIAELRRSDIKLIEVENGEIGVIRVRRGVTYRKGGTIVKEPKSEEGSRDVTMPPHLIPYLKHHLYAHASPRAGGLLFPAAGGGHLWPSVVRTHLKAAAAAAGRPELRFHDLRHTGAVLAAQSGATVADLQARLGHATVDAAMLYQHTAKGRDLLIAQQLSAMAAPKPAPAERTRKRGRPARPADDSPAADGGAQS